MWFLGGTRPFGIVVRIRPPRFHSLATGTTISPSFFV
jgi:hypothetical protein